jgi:outer membrane murein-binding lipoprotein Lpp
MKKILTILIVLLGLFALVGCDSTPYGNSKIVKDIELVDSNLTEKIDNIKNQIEALQYKVAVLGGVDNRFEEEIDALKAQLDIYLEKLLEFESYRYVYYKKSDIRTIQIFDKLKNKTVVYEIRDNVSVKEVIYDTWKSKIYISYVQGYMIELEYIFCTFFVS